jgi:hypothetical protein
LGRTVVHDNANAQEGDDREIQVDKKENKGKISGASTE